MRTVGQEGPIGGAQGEQMDSVVIGLVLLAIYGLALIAYQ